MTGWAKDQKTPGTMLKLLGDPTSEFTKALGLVLDDPGPMSVLGNPRCKRFSMLIDDGVIKSLNVAEGPDDPAGDAAPQVSMVDKMLTDLGAGAALQYPVAAPSQTLQQLWANPQASAPATARNAATSAHSQWSAKPLQPSMSRSIPRVAPRAMGLPRYYEDQEPEQPDLASVLAAGLIGAFCGSGSTLALWYWRRGTLAAVNPRRQPLLSA